MTTQVSKIAPREITDLGEIAHVSFEIGLKIGSVEQLEVMNVPDEELGHAPAPDALEAAVQVQLHARGLADPQGVRGGEPRRKRRHAAVRLAGGEPEHTYDCHPAGQRLGDASHEVKLLRARQPEGTGSSIRSDTHLDDRQQLRRVLHLVDEDWRGVALHEQLGVVSSQRPEVVIVEGHVAPPLGLSQMGEQRRLADLPGAREQEDRELSRRGAPAVFNATRLIARRLIHAATSNLPIAVDKPASRVRRR